jgi:hypothetical protein
MALRGWLFAEFLSNRFSGHGELILSDSFMRTTRRRAEKHIAVDEICCPRQQYGVCSEGNFRACYDPKKSGIIGAKARNRPHPAATRPPGRNSR